MVSAEDSGKQEKQTTNEFVGAILLAKLEKQQTSPKQPVQPGWCRRFDAAVEELLETTWYTDEGPKLYELVELCVTGIMISGG